MDERLTSVEAEQLLNLEKKSGHFIEKGLIDRKAAAIILQRWLDLRRSNQLQLVDAPHT